MNLRSEWLEVDGLGGYASGTIGGIRTRRYHGVLVAARTPPTGRHVLVNGFDAFVETEAGRFPLSSQLYAPDVVAPDGRMHLVDFASEPWPTWTFRLPDGTEVTQELTVVHGAPLVVLWWQLTPRKENGRRGAKAMLPAARLFLRPFLSGRDFHALHHENDAFRFDAEEREGEPSRKDSADSRLSWRPYDSVAGVASLANGVYRHEPHWYRTFLYEEEAARGFESREDLGSPGELVFDLGRGPAVWILGAFEGETARESLLGGKESAAVLARMLRSTEAKRRAAFRSPLHRSAESFLAKRGDGCTVIAGYPWFADWGRDAFLALRGLCLSLGRLDEARSILLEWSGALSNGMLPNRFVEEGEQPEYNSVDASLWFVVAVEELLAAAKKSRRRIVSSADEKKLLAAVRAILEAFVKGARFGIKVDDDDLLAAGEPGSQLTWMDARSNGREVTPRIGKPVEVQALWYNALTFAASVFKDGDRWKARAADAHDSFLERFWNEAGDHLFDVVDVDHVKGTTDASFRPNQVFAVGGLPRPLLVGPRARKVVDAVEAKLATPMGLRTLAPDDPRYCPRYEGPAAQRDCAYHQGTVWPWLVGPFVDAWTRVRGNTPASRREAHKRFVQPLLDQMAENRSAHVAELADGEPPHEWCGAPFQAWSLSELLRVAPDARIAGSKAAAARTA
jgi:predicted glycogen debranching enzyme